MPVAAELTTDLKKVVLTLEDDLRERVEAQPHVKQEWEDEHRSAVARERTAMSWQAWRDDRVTQSAVAWALTTVFIRFCEDNGLLRPVWLAGPPARRQEALDAELAYFREHPEHTAREWIGQAIAHLGTVHATKRARREPLAPVAREPVGPGRQGTRRLLARQDRRRRLSSATSPTRSCRPASSAISTRTCPSTRRRPSRCSRRRCSSRSSSSTRRWSRPSPSGRSRASRMIDPTCGSGHFLLGAFARLTDRWATHAPGLEVQARVQKALDAVHGVDLNPFAVAIARFRLIVAALQACGLRSLEDAPGFQLNLAAGDSLLHGGHQLSMQFDGFDADSEISGFTYATEDLDTLRRILTPGATTSSSETRPTSLSPDTTLNAAVPPRCTRLATANMQLTVPFMERFFQLAKRGVGDQPAGWTGQITSNSFMKREFGSKLIEKFLAQQDLRLVVDTSGAYIPGHGTPTVIIVGRPQTAS